MIVYDCRIFFRFPLSCSHSQSETFVAQGHTTPTSGTQTPRTKAGGGSLQGFGKELLRAPNSSKSVFFDEMLEAS